MNPPGADPAKPFPVPRLADAARLADSVLGGLMCAVTRAEKVVCWSRAAREPVPVPNLGGVSQVSVGMSRACAVHTDGRVSCWNHAAGASPGQTRNGPGEIEGLTKVAEVKVGRAFACARRWEGQVLCWGENRQGQLGTPPSQEGESPPVPVVGVEGAVGLFVDDDSAYAPMRGGETRCWGYNDGRFGKQEGKLPPTPVAGLVGATAIALRSRGLCAVLQDGSLTCRSLREPPTLSGVTQLASGSGHTCALRRDGTVACFGTNDSGQCGAPVKTRSVFPPSTVQGLPVVPTGQEETALPHPLLVDTHRALRGALKTDAAKQRLDAISLAGTVKGDKAAMVLFSVNHTVRTLGPRLFKAVVREGMWPRGHKDFIKKFERMPPLRPGGEYDAAVMREFRDIAEELVGGTFGEIIWGEGRVNKPPSERQMAVAAGIAALAQLMDQGSLLAGSKTGELTGDLDHPAGVVHVLIELEGEAPPVVDASLKLLSGMAEIARRPAP
jgi:hypothetical protein